MSGKPCSVSLCKNTDKSTNVSLHRFPRDSKLRKLWISKCRRKDKINPETARICSAHFKPEDFERDLKAELLGCRRRAILKQNVIPTLNLKETCVNSAAEARRKRMLEKSEKERHVRLVESALEKPSISSETPTRVCSVSTCHNSTLSRKSVNDVIFFPFPKDAKLQREWVKRCSRPESFDPTYKSVCSKHFKCDDFQDAAVAAIQNRLPKILKSHTVPSLNLKSVKKCGVDNKWNSGRGSEEKEIEENNSDSFKSKIRQKWSCLRQTCLLNKIKKSHAPRHEGHKPHYCYKTVDHRLGYEGFESGCYLVGADGSLSRVEGRGYSGNNNENDMDYREEVQITQNGGEAQAVAHDVDMETRISHFMSNKVQILFAELL